MDLNQEKRGRPRAPLYTREQRRRRDASVWTKVQGVLAIVQFGVFLVSLTLVLRYLLTGNGWEAATVSNRDFAAAGAGRPRDSRRDAGATVGRLLLQLAWLSATPVVHCVHCAFESVTPARRPPAPVLASAG